MVLKFEGYVGKTLSDAWMDSYCSTLDFEVWDERLGELALVGFGFRV